jgi:hypothetical protein
MWWASEGPTAPQTPQGISLTTARCLRSRWVRQLFTFSGLDGVKPIVARSPLFCSINRPGGPGGLEVGELNLGGDKALVVPKTSVVGLAGKLAVVEPNPVERLMLLGLFCKCCVQAHLVRTEVHGKHIGAKVPLLVLAQELDPEVA